MEEEKEEPKKPWDDQRYEYNYKKRSVEIWDATMEHLQNSPELKKYLEGFQTHLIEKQLNTYARRKAEWLTESEYREYWHNWRLLQLKNDAEECLGNIQQRRLFEKNCEWRAGVFDHPAIQCSLDFKYWEANILNCPFLDPITQEDIELYIEYLNTYFGENLPFIGHWQDYDTYLTNRITVIGQMNKPVREEEEEDEEIEEELEDEEMEDEDFEDDDLENEVDEEDDVEDEEEDQASGRLMPPWYLFWDEKRGAGTYRLLKDIRTEKEREYSKVAYEEEREKALERFKAEPPDKRPFFSLWKREEIINFINRFEKPEERDQIIKGYEIFEKLYNDPEENKAMEEVKEAWYDLEDCWESFPISPNITDWKEALIATAKNWQHQKLIRMIPIVFDEYVFRNETGIAHPYDYKREESKRKQIDGFKEKILRGRELRGEPRDFDFYD